MAIRDDPVPWASRTAMSAEPMPHGAALRAAVVLAPALLVGCATYSETFHDVERNLVAQDYERALAALERAPGPARDRALYLLNKGMLERLRGGFAASNESFEAAKQLMDQLAAVSVSEQATSFVINDATRSYAGEEYEQVLVHLYKALNYLQLKDLPAARVEALQVDVRLREIAEKLPQAHYGEDALARYLTGLIYEELGEWSDALIAYRKSYEAYQRQQPHTRVEVPEFLKHDLLRLADRQGLNNERDRYKREFGIERWQSVEERRALGEVVLVLHNGLAPILRERSLTVPDGSGHFVRIALPYFESRPAPVARVELGDGAGRASGAVAENIDAIARNHLEAKMAAITARAVARQVVKAQMARQARENAHQNSQNAWAGVFALAVEIGTVVTERADTRSWVLLPYDIQLARLTLPPGRHDVRVELYGEYNQLVATRDFPGIELRAGEKRYLELAWMPTHLPERRR
jgi:hypothetical protein